jgi:hypothetical protein
MIVYPRLSCDDYEGRLSWNDCVLTDPDVDQEEQWPTKERILYLHILNLHRSGMYTTYCAQRHLGIGALININTTIRPRKIVLADRLTFYII